MNKWEIQNIDVEVKEYLLHHWFESRFWPLCHVFLVFLICPVFHSESLSRVSQWVTLGNRAIVPKIKKKSQESSQNYIFIICDMLKAMQKMSLSFGPIFAAVVCFHCFSQKSLVRMATAVMSIFFFFYWWS